ncbi:ZZ-type zinc finger-containing protein 3 [Ischnura elegans]|uniref:ZZ-type zinc finger-containing protein 3 n=1 Tax=Ischnura elegans TaxID=197161 RepID=UPI001ED88431|nr:ZZ-type zinc finger-containing protein 3 [Ischnura elegans]
MEVKTEMESTDLETETSEVKIKEEIDKDEEDFAQKFVCPETAGDSEQPEEEDKYDSGVFYFETDQLALKANKDYHNLLRTIVILEAQREMAIKAIEQVSDVLKEAENDPKAFIDKLRKGESLGMPETQKVPELPSIDWSRYNLPTPPDHYRLSRKIKTETESSAQQESWDSDKRSKYLVRGKAFDDSKPQTFNQLWTTEEQRRLEELLLEFPPEEIETRRWEKIAEALGNRTAKQVQSRVQKYFIKLQKAGLPIPGRCPRLQNETNWRKSSHKHQRNNHLLYRPSTFFPSHDVPMGMSDSDDEVSLPKRAMVSKDYPVPDDVNKDSLSDQESVGPTLKKEKCSREQLKLEMMKKVWRELEKTSSGPKFRHVGFKCEFCKEEPILGTRWHCDECMSSGGLSIDYCSDCVITLMEDSENPFSSITMKPKGALSNPHPLDHNLQPIRGQTGKTTTGVWDPDYLPDSFSGGYNYLDPNFMPE